MNLFLFWSVKELTNIYGTFSEYSEDLAAQIT